MIRGWHQRPGRDPRNRTFRKERGAKLLRARRLAAALALATIAVLGPGVPDGRFARAQQPQRAVLNVAPITLVEPASKSPFPIQVGPQEALLKNSFVRIRGLPPAAALSEGHSVSPGSWAVPLVGLPQLNLVMPVGLQGRWDIEINLVTIDGTVLTAAKTVLVVGPAQLIAPVVPKREQSATSVASLGGAGSPPSPVPSSPERERLLGLHERGQELLGQGNIQPARMLFKRAAEGGLAQSALAMGGTYDPIELAKIRVIGLQPDVEAARRWYKKAEELGSAEAAARLQRLQNR